jgi:hypothetical protein
VSLVTYSALTAGLNYSGGTTVKVRGICDRDRSVTAGRSRFLFAYPSLYILLGDCQDIARQALVLSDIGKAILTPVTSSSISPLISQVYTSVSRLAIQKRRLLSTYSLFKSRKRTAFSPTVCFYDSRFFFPCVSPDCGLTLFLREIILIFRSRIQANMPCRAG